MTTIINKIRSVNPQIVVLGNHQPIIQSILDFDYLSKKTAPSIVGIVGNANGYAKYFWGKKEILIRTFISLRNVENKERISWFLNMVSGRRVLSSGLELLEQFPNLLGGVFFAENVPEKNALDLYYRGNKKGYTLIGPASIGLLVPGHIKLGPIGGVTADQVIRAHLTEQGSVAVLSASGGMTNELITIVNQSGLRISFAVSFGGERFPLLAPNDALLLAQQDEQTKLIVYYGELGGEDEYQLIDMKEKGLLTKPVFIHIAGTVATLFPESPQFGHAKAKAQHEKETAMAKRLALRKAGFTVTERFGDMMRLLSAETNK